MSEVLGCVYEDLILKSMHASAINNTQIACFQNFLKLPGISSIRKLLHLRQLYIMSELRLVKIVGVHEECGGEIRLAWSSSMRGEAVCMKCGSVNPKKVRKREGKNREWKKKYKTKSKLKPISFSFSDFLRIPPNFHDKGIVAIDSYYELMKENRSVKNMCLDCEEEVCMKCKYMGGL